jgi:hypothetical protein
MVEVARLLWVTSRRPLVIPMSIPRRSRFDFITSRLRRICPDLLCVRLTAPREVLMQHGETYAPPSAAYCPLFSAGGGGALTTVILP